MVLNNLRLKSEFIPVLSIGLSIISLELTLGDGLNELEGTFTSVRTSKSNQRERPRGPELAGPPLIDILSANSSCTKRTTDLSGVSEWCL